MAELNKNVNPTAPVAANPTENVGNPAGAVRAEGDEAPQIEPSKLDNLKKMMSSRYPDDKFDTDDDYYSRIADDYENYDNELNGYKEREKAIGGLFVKDPRSEQFMKDWINGEDPEVALIRRHGKEDFMAALEDPEKLDKIAAANQEYVDRVAKERDLEEEYKQNLAQTLEDIEAYQKENGLSDEQIDKAMTYLVESSKNIIMGKFTPELILAATKAMNYDKDVESASREGEVRGKNANIEAKLRKPQQGDGIPQMGSRAAGMNSQMPKIAGALGNEKRSVWETGGEKRTPARR